MSAPDRVFDGQEILRVLTDYGVEFLVVGAVAVQAHGYVRSTLDLDVVARPTLLNLSRLAEALADLGAEPRHAGAQMRLTDPNWLKRAPVVAVVTRAGWFDVLNVETIGRSYDELQGGALTIELRGLAINVVGLRDLIRMKKAAGRPQDLADIEALTRPDDTS
jgi:predicted nucleotidyltransferase